MDHSNDCDSLPPGTYAYGLYGPPKNLYHIRVDDQYQAEIPSLMTDSEYYDYIKNPFVEEEERKVGAVIDLLTGLDIPIVQINQENMKDNEDSTSGFSAEIKNIKNDNVLVPGCVLESWSEVEKGNFVLGLYIFGKDFVRLNRFMEGKKMGDILSYYYGSFYRSDEHKRWSECRKSRGKKCIMGQRIFSGIRQQEFLARLVPHVSQECQNDLFEVARAFGDTKISLEQYVFSIKTLIGIEKFIDAVAIGKGKQDLTGNAIEPTKQNQAIRIRPEIPIGKACSSLTSSEIIQFLTGDYRLSKARSNNLFWEAVWPILLARGWHSEQPSDHNYAANGNIPLVFLMPGVKKFSRKLVKGDAYLDSVTDVLTKVASDPQLLELDKEENGENEMKLKDEEENVFVEKRKSHCYLQPRASSLNLGNVVVKLTVVDTSLRGGKTFRVRELDTMKLSLRSHFDESRSELGSSDVSDCEYMFLVDQEMSVNRQKPAKKQKTSDDMFFVHHGMSVNRQKPAKKQKISDDVFLVDQEMNHNRQKPAKKQETSDDMFLVDQEMSLNRQKPAKKQKTSNESKNLDNNHVKTASGLDTILKKAKLNKKRSEENSAQHAKQRRRLTACIHVDSKAGSSLDSHVGSSSQANNNNNHNLSSNLSFTSKCSSIDTVDEQQHQQPQLMNLIDLNYPHVTPEFENGELVTEVKDVRNKPVPPRQSENVVGPENGGSSRRQSTRNRPPTARALEAIANGFLTVNSRKGSKDKQESKSRNYQNTLGEVAVVSECSTGDASSAVKGENENGEVEK